MESQAQPTNQILKKINIDFLDLIQLKQELNELDFNSEEYDEIEDELIAFEDTFLKKYGRILEKVISKIHKNYAPEIEPLLPTAYVGNKYIVDTISNEIVNIDPKGGILLETPYDDAKGMPIHIRVYIMPNPVRIEVRAKHKQFIVWSETNPESLNLEQL